MPRGPRGERRPSDTIGAAITVARIATREVTDAASLESAAAELGRKGGRARATRLSPEQRHKIAQRAAAARWAKNDR